MCHQDVWQCIYLIMTCTSCWVSQISLSDIKAHVCVCHSNDSPQKKLHQGDFLKHPLSKYCKYKKLQLCNYVLHTKYFLTDISHLFITPDKMVTKCPLNVQTQLTGYIAYMWQRSKTTLHLLRQPGVLRDPDLRCRYVLCLSSRPPFLPLIFFFFLFFCFSWHKSGRWKCHGAGSFCKEVLIAMRL